MGGEVEGRGGRGHPSDSKGKVEQQSIALRGMIFGATPL